MLSVLLTIPISFMILSLFGYVLHRMLHQPYMGKFYRSHLVHHFKLYPPEHFSSLVYREPGKDNTVIVFLMFGAPLIVLPIVLCFWGVISWPVFVCASICLAVFGGLNNYLHDAFHLTEHWLLRYGWFKRLVALHYLHHVHVQSNYGIYWFGWDKVFGSYWSKQ